MITIQVNCKLCEVGNRMFITLFKGQEDDLNKLRFLTYMNLVTTAKGIVKPGRSPPTRMAAKFHSCRVYLQLSQWLSFNNSDKLPSEWCWKLENEASIPIPTTLEAAPSELLNLITCKCKVTSKNPCSTNVCSCKKNGLPCVTPCGNFHGYDCCNVGEVILDVESNSSDEDSFDRNIFDLFD